MGEHHTFGDGIFPKQVISSVAQYSTLGSTLIKLSNFRCQGFEDSAVDSPGFCRLSNAFKQFQATTAMPMVLRYSSQTIKLCKQHVLEKRGRWGDQSEPKGFDRHILEDGFLFVN